MYRPKNSNSRRRGKDFWISNCSSLRFHAVKNRKLSADSLGQFGIGVILCLPKVAVPKYELESLLDTKQNDIVLVSF